MKIALKLPKIVHFLQMFLQICAELSKKSKFIKAFINIHLKDLIMLFQKIICFIGLSEQQLIRYWGLKYQKSADSAELLTKVSL